VRSRFCLGIVSLSSKEIKERADGRYNKRAHEGAESAYRAEQPRARAIDGLSFLRMSARSDHVLGCISHASRPFSSAVHDRKRERPGKQLRREPRDVARALLVTLHRGAQRESARGRGLAGAAVLMEARR
jgi:hypothetical protein